VVSQCWIDLRENTLSIFQMIHTIHATLLTKKAIKHGHYASVCYACKVYYCRPSPDSVKAYVRAENDVRPVPTVVYDNEGVAFEIRHE
jgi:transposase-like protein